VLTYLPETPPAESEEIDADEHDDVDQEVAA
jgi:hypothetical protein